MPKPAPKNKTRSEPRKTSAGKFSQKKSPVPQKQSPFPQKKKPLGPKGFKKKRNPDEFLDIQLTDKELGEVETIKRKLAEIREYKKILAEDGLKPDLEDKARESQLIVRLLRIEKNAKMAARQRAKAAKTEKFREAEEQAAFEKEKKNARKARFSDED